MSSLTKFNTDWRLTTIGEEFDIRLGKMLDEKKNVGQLKPYVGNRSVQWGRIDTSDLSTMALSIEDQKTYRLKQGDLLVCEGGEVGRCAIWNSTMECYYQKAIHRLRSKNGYRADLLAHYFEYWTSHDLLGDFVTKTSIAHLTKEKLAEIPLPVPSQQEQDAIASALSDMDALLAKLDQLIAKKRDIKQAAMQKMLSGHGNQHTEQWTQAKLGEIFSFKNGLNKAKEYFGHGNPIINYMDVYANNSISTSKINGKVMVDAAELKAYDVQRGDVFFTRTSETVDEIAASAVVLGETTSTVFSGFLLRARPKNNILLDEFKAYCFQARYIRSQITSTSSYTTRALTNGRLLSNVIIKIPPIEQQAEIAAGLNAMDTEITALEARREKTRLIKQGMMQELLSGRVRLI